MVLLGSLPGVRRLIPSLSFKELRGCFHTCETEGFRIVNIMPKSGVEFMGV